MSSKVCNFENSISDSKIIPLIDFYGRPVDDLKIAGHVSVTVNINENVFMRMHHNINC